MTGQEELIKNALIIMVQGMTGLLITTFIIMGVIWLFNCFVGRKDEKKE